MNRDSAEAQHRVDAVDVTSSPGYRDDIQGLRAIAVIAVILYHAGDLLPGGFLGVDVFFVISGFVITRSLQREHDRAGRLSLRDFYRRRIQRLTPALTVAIVGSVSLHMLLGPLGALRQTAKAGLAATLFSANFFFARGSGYFDPAAERNSLLHTWSLSLEEQFYLIYPVVLASLFWLSRRRSSASQRPLLIGLLVASLASLTLSLYLSYGPPLPGVSIELTRRLAFFMMPARAWQFGAGGLAAIAAHRRTSFRRSGTSLGLVGAGLLVLCLLLLDDGLTYPGIWALVPTGATVLLLSDTGGPASRLLADRRLVRVGDVSYSWYLWHWPAIVFVSALGIDSKALLAAAGIASYPLAATTYERIEQRFRGSRSKLSWRSLAAASVMLGTAVFMAGSFAADSALTIAPASAAGLEHADRTCALEPLFRDLEGCRFGTGPTVVVLIGDSNAGHFTEAVLGAVDSRETTVKVVTRPACPLIAVVVLNSGQPDSACRRQTMAVDDWLLAEPPDVAILATASDIHLGLQGRALRRGNEKGRDAYGAALLERVRALQRDETVVVVVHPIPKFSLGPEFDSGVDGCSTLSLRALPSTCEQIMSRSGGLERRAEAISVESAVARRTGARLIDPFDTICPGDPCSSRQGDTWLYSDARHLSVAAAHLLVPVFEQAIGRTVDPPQVDRSRETDG